MGKVGSSSIKTSLAKAWPERAVFHIHTLHADRLRSIEDRSRAYFGTHRQGKLRHVWQSQFLLRRGLVTGIAERPLVITLTRDPVARNVSTLFEHLAVERLAGDQGWHVVSTEYDFEIDVHDDDFGQLVDLFLERCSHDSPIEFFDREISAVCGVDVYERPFDRERGFAILDDGAVTVIVIRVEDLNRCASEALGSLCHSRDIDLTDTNVSSKKPYAALYAAFKNDVRLPAEYLDRMYSSRYARHFYAPDEIARYRQRWA